MLRSVTSTLDQHVLVGSVAAATLALSAEYRRDVIWFPNQGRVA